MENTGDEAEKKTWYEKYFSLTYKYRYFIIAGLVALVALAALAYSVHAQETVTTTLFHRPEWTFNITGIGDQVSEFAKSLDVGKAFGELSANVPRKISDFVLSLLCVFHIGECA